MRSTRSFGRSVYSRRDLAQALASHAGHLGVKLRREGLATGFATAFASAGKGSGWHSGSVRFQVATDDSEQLISSVQSLLPRLYHEGTGYKKCGVLADHLIPKQSAQLQFGSDIVNFARTDAINARIDMINSRWGSRTLKFAAEGVSQPWQSSSAYRSNRYTTEWGELRVVS